VTPGQTLTFQIVSSDLKGEARVWFTVRPVGVPELTMDNNTYELTLQPTS
jgi:hypothetical protein